MRKVVTTILFVMVKFDITHGIIYNDTKNDIEYELTYKEIMEKIEEMEFGLKKAEYI